ncbi:helix-turn-helix domain-containing protein [Actinomadura sp. 9N215]|uniref:helix-turn-helix domain-containing protein n=1 Tax=Actinomadura sp. 9N215 TaxID=3375150 RepID=UPI0037A92A5B
MSEDRPSRYVEGALIHGVSAHVLDRVLRWPVVAGALDDLPVWMRPEVEAARRAIRWAAAEYEALPLVAAADGIAAAQEAETVPPSRHGEITTGEAAGLLRLSERRVRQLAAQGMGRRAGGRWLLDRSAVLAYADRRRSA